MLLKFDEYRIQFKPTGSDASLWQDAMKNKNETFSKILDEKLIVQYKGKDLNYKGIALKNSKYYFRIANSKKKRIEKDFHIQHVKDEPSSSIFIWNNPNEQRIFIESDITAFTNSKVLAGIFERALNMSLYDYNLRAEIKGEIEESEFWDLAERYKDKITQISFKFTYPNLPSAHRDISEDITAATRSLNADEAGISFTANNSDTLSNINPDNENLVNLNRAASIQGMPVGIRVKGMKMQKTGSTLKHFEAEEIDFEDYDQLEKFADKFFNSDTDQ
ncbi:MAG TPA: hypothetical protein PLI68_09440 [Bacteroidia bacterium]|nr:hypothetical protein [Bacteroidia bacterium]